MVGNAVLREVIGTDFLTSVTGPNQFFARIRQFFLLFINLHLQQTRTQHTHRLSLILNLRFFILLRYYQTSGQVRNPHCRIGCINALTTVATGVVDVNP